MSKPLTNLLASRQEVYFAGGGPVDDAISGRSAPGEALLSDGLSREKATRPGSRLTSIEATAEALRLLFPSNQAGKSVAKETFTQDSPSVEIRILQSQNAPIVERSRKCESTLRIMLA